MRNISMASVLAAIGAMTASHVTTMREEIGATGMNTRPTRRTTKFTSHKPSSFKTGFENMRYLNVKKIALAQKNARMWNDGLEKKTRMTKSGKFITRHIPNPGTLVMGVR